MMEGISYKIKISLFIHKGNKLVTETEHITMLIVYNVSYCLMLKY